MAVDAVVCALVVPLFPVVPSEVPVVLVDPVVPVVPVELADADQTAKCITRWCLNKVNYLAVVNKTVLF